MFLTSKNKHHIFVCTVKCFAILPVEFLTTKNECIKLSWLYRSDERDDEAQVQKGYDMAILKTALLANDSLRYHPQIHA